MIKKCTYADKYEGIYPPKCGPDKRGCEVCWEKWDKAHPLSKKLLKQLRETMNELSDPHCYLVVSSILDSWHLFYCVHSNCFSSSMKKSVIPECTRFKDIKIAKAVMLALNGKRKKSLEIWKVKENKKTKKLKFVEKV